MSNDERGNSEKKHQHRDVSVALHPFARLPRFTAYLPTLLLARACPRWATTTNGPRRCDGVGCRTPTRRAICTSITRRSTRVCYGVAL